MTTLLAFLFVLGVLIFVHELGHFLAARRVGVRVLTFSLGFGPKILKFTRGDTEYCVSAIPLGGYVKMAGESPDDPRSGQPDEFLSKTKWQRFQILIMGPVMNIVLAVVVLGRRAGAGRARAAYHDQPPVVGVVERGLAGRARRPACAGDRILTVGRRRGRDLGGSADTPSATKRQPRCRRSRSLRDGQNVTVTVTPDGRGPATRSADIGVLPATRIPSSIRSIAGDPAEAAGLKAGDVDPAVNGERDGVPRRS